MISEVVHFNSINLLLNGNKKHFSEQVFLLLFCLTGVHCRLQKLFTRWVDFYDVCKVQQYVLVSYGYIGAMGILRFNIQPAKVSERYLSYKKYRNIGLGLVYLGSVIILKDYNKKSEN